MENFQEKDLKRLSFLGQFVGYIMIAYSIIITFQNLIPSIVGGIPGLIGICIGKLPYDTGSEGKILLHSNGRNFTSANMILQKLSISLMITGILLFILIISYAIIIFAGFTYDYYVGDGLIVLHSNYLKRFSIWGRVVGIITAIYGIIVIAIAFFTYYIFIISGLVSIWLGKLVFNIGREAKKVLQKEETPIQIKDVKAVFN